jgi:hypothetical protein
MATSSRSRSGAGQIGRVIKSCPSPPRLQMTAKGHQKQPFRHPVGCRWMMMVPPVAVIRRGQVSDGLQL